MKKSLKVLLALLLAVGVVCAAGMTATAEGNGLYPAGDTWLLYMDGMYADWYTGLYFDANYGWWLLRNGIVCFDYTGMWNDPNYGWWLVGGGTVCFDYNGIWDDPNCGSWIISGGRPMEPAAPAFSDGLHDDGNGWHLYLNGEVASWYTGLYGDATYGWWLVQNGAVNFGYTGLYCDLNVGWWLVQNGAVNFGYTGLYCDANVGWWMLRNGTIAWDYTGLWEDPAYGWWLLGGGTVCFDYNGVWNDPNLGSWIISGGRPVEPAVQADGLVCGDDGVWRLFLNGEFASGYTGLYGDATYGWWMIGGGRIAWEFSGIWNDPNYGWWLIKDGAIDWGYTGSWDDPDLGILRIVNGHVETAATDAYVNMWVSGNAVDLTRKQIEDFNNTNQYGIRITANIIPVSEGEAAGEMIADLASGGDIYCFAQDQLARLVLAGALTKLDDADAITVAANNDAGSVAAASSGNSLYAYPLTSDNGYFMYYDKSVIPEADVNSLEKLIADCEAAGRYFAFEQESGWYLSSFFFGAGCHSEWRTDASGNFIAVDDDFNSENGLIAAKGVKKLVDSPCYISASDASLLGEGAAIVVSGTWDLETARAILGDNLGVTDLPSVEVNGAEYHLGSYNGCKLLGVKPQADTAKEAALQKLAGYLTGEKAQMERYETLSWGPTNTADQASPAVQADPGQAALIAQAPYSVPQGQIHGAWWDISRALGEEIKAASGETEIKNALANYAGRLRNLISETAK